MAPLSRQDTVLAWLVTHHAGLQHAARSLQPAPASAIEAMSRARSATRQRGRGGACESRRSKTRARPPRSGAQREGLGRGHRRRRPGADHRLPDPRGRPGAARHRRRTRGAGAVVGYDMATGFGLVQPLAPLRIEAVTARPFGRVWRARAADGGQRRRRRRRQCGALVSRRPFAGYWEYRIDGALVHVTRPHATTAARACSTAAANWSASARCWWPTRSARARRVPGNMFVPIDLLKPILDELRIRAAPAGSSRRAWMGVNCVEKEAGVRVVRVNDRQPGRRRRAASRRPHRAHRRRRSEVLDVLWKTLWRGGPPEREVTLDIQREARADAEVAIGRPDEDLEAGARDLTVQYPALRSTRFGGASPR